MYKSKPKPTDRFTSKGLPAKELFLLNELGIHKTKEIGRQLKKRWRQSFIIDYKV